MHDEWDLFLWSLFLARITDLAAPKSIMRVNSEVLSRIKMGPWSPTLGFLLPSSFWVSLDSASVTSLLQSWFPRIICIALTGVDSAFFSPGKGRSLKLFRNADFCKYLHYILQQFI